VGAIFIEACILCNNLSKQNTAVSTAAITQDIVSGVEDPTTPIISSPPEGETPESVLVSYLEVVDYEEPAVPVIVNVGDQYAGWTAEEIEASKKQYSNGASELNYVSAKFNGEATLKGKIYASNDRVFDAGQAIFQVAEESLTLLPQAVGDTREGVWLTFTNNDEVKQMVGKDEFEYDCEIVISDYAINIESMLDSNSATLLNIYLTE